MNLFVAAFAALCLLPFLLVIIASLSSEKSITLNGYTYFPSEWSLEAYKVMTAPSSSLPRSYLITIAVTGIGTFCAALITYCAGYALANRLCKYRNALALYFFATMVFSAGLVPWYMIAKMLGCYNNIFALIVPSLMFSPFNMFLVRNFIAGIPDSLNESARIDGAGELHIAFRIYFPLCTPVLATVTLFYAIGYWNNYFNAVMLLDSQKLYPLQMLLFKIQSEITMMSRVLQGVNLNPPKESFKMAAAVVVMGPIILLYPLLQRYFIKGMIVGAIKG